MSDVAARPAAACDSAVLLSWRNDAQTRRWSRTPDPVPLDKHAAWLISVLDDPARHLWMVEECGRPVATVRHDQVLPGRFEVSVTVAPEERGRGLAGKALAAAQQCLSETEPRTQVIEAHVQPHNAGSLSVFVQAGYCDAGRDGDGLAVLELTVGP